MYCPRTIGKKSFLFLFIVQTMFVCSCLAQKQFELNVNIGAKTDWRISDRITPIIHLYNSPYSPIGTVQVSEVSGMKYYSRVYPFFALYMNYLPLRNKPYELDFKISYAKRGQLFKEYIIDTLNTNDMLEFTYTFIDFGLGASYKIDRIRLGILANYQLMVDSKIKYSPKNFPEFESDHPKSHWYLTPKYIWEFSIIYTDDKIKYYPGVGLFIQPYFNESKSIALGLTFNLKII